MSKKRLLTSFILLFSVVFLSPFILFYSFVIFSRGKAATVSISGNWKNDNQEIFFRDLNRFAVLLDENGWEVNVDYIERDSGPTKVFFEKFNKYNKSKIYGVLAEKLPIHSLMSIVPIVPVEGLYIRVYEKGSKWAKTGTYLLAYNQFSKCIEGKEAKRQKYLELAKLVEEEYGVDITNQKIYFGDCSLLN